MSGVCGVIRAAELNREQRQLGPADVVTHVVDSVVLGHTRPAAPDLAEPGHQPLASPDGSVLVVFDGVIANHRELRRRYDLSTASACDGAVLPDLWQRLGTSMFAQLRGVYAMAIYDRRSRTVTLARDPLGAKRLHWTRTERDALAFASEPRPLAGMLAARRLNPTVLSHFLSTGEALSDQSPFEGIEPVPVNGWMQWSLNGTAIHGPASGVVYPGGFADTVGTGLHDLRAEFLAAVSGQLTSDVPVAVPLTSEFGAASVAWACAELGRSLPCVTVDLGYGRPERDDAMRLAARYGHQPETVSGEPDEPAMAQYFLSMHAPTVRGLKTFLIGRAIAGCGARVAIAGTGAEELLVGHPRPRLLHRLPLLRRNSRGPRPAWRPAHDFDSLSIVSSVEQRTPYADVRLVHAVLGSDRERGPSRVRFAEQLGDPRLIEIARAGSGRRALPLEQWMRHGPLAPWVRALASPDAPVRRLLRDTPFESMLADWSRGRLDRSQVWRIASLNGWLGTLHPDFADQCPTLPPPPPAARFVATTADR